MTRATRTAERVAFVLALGLAWGSLAAQQVAPTQAPETGPIRFGVSPILARDEIEREFRALAERLGEVVGRRVEIIVGSTYAETTDSAVDGRVDLVYLTPVSYVIARERRPDLKLLLTDVRGGLDFYNALLVVRADDRFQAVQDLRGSRIVFVDRESASGYVYPLHYLANLGLTPSTFGEARFSGNHERSIRMLLEREVDVAAVSSALLEGIRDRGLDLSDVTILARAGIIPQDVICSTGLLPIEVEARLVEAFLSITSLTDEGRRVLPRALRLNGWRRTDPANYDDVAKTLRGGGTAALP